jgi:hypothetical protein
MSPKGENNATLKKLLNSSNNIAKENVKIPVIGDDGKTEYEDIVLTITPLNNRQADRINSLHEGNFQRMGYEFVTTAVKELKDLTYEQYKNLGFGTTSQITNKILEVSGLKDSALSNKIQNF